MTDHEHESQAQTAQEPEHRVNHDWSGEHRHLWTWPNLLEDPDQVVWGGHHSRHRHFDGRLWPYYESDAIRRGEVQPYSP